MNQTSGIYRWLRRGVLGVVPIALAGMLVLPAAAELYEPVLVNGFTAAPSNLTNVGGALFFTANDGSTGVELWKSDGTAGGTSLVKDIRLGGSSSPFRLIDLNGTLLFSANDGVSGNELWRSDGTEAGTMMVKEIGAGSASGSGSSNFITSVGSTAYFIGVNASVGQELWKTDGTEAGTVLVKDISTGNSQIEMLANVGGTLFFRANDGVSGQELWKSDGTEAGTVMVKNIHPTSNSEVEFITNVGGTAFFKATNGTIAQGGVGRELWKSDGTDAGTVLVKDINVTDFGALGGGSPQLLTNFNGTLFFVADNVTAPLISGDPFTGSAYELWKSDGTEAGTVMVKDIRPGVSSSSMQNLTVVGSNLFFSANDGTNGAELWKSDGTEAGTVLAVELSAGSAATSFVANSFRAVGDKLFFVATPNGGVRQLFVTDGTLAGTESLFTATSITNLTVSGSYLYFNSGNDLYAMPLIETLTPGDFDGDGDVDGADFITWQTNFPKQSGASLAEGDANGDGKVDGADFAAWQDNFSHTPGSGTSPVPEPSTALLTLTAAILFLARRVGRGSGNERVKG